MLNTGITQGKCKQLSHPLYHQNANIYTITNEPEWQELNRWRLSANKTPIAKIDTDENISGKLFLRSNFGLPLCNPRGKNTNVEVTYW